MSIASIRVYGPIGEFGETEEYVIGVNTPTGAITSITQRDEAPEPYCTQSYIQVWCGNELYAEFPKQNLAAIYYSSPDQTEKAD